ncbi:tectonic-3 [Lasioglossum baleicum]|uniref:tectonic-3 n=1 Tax=Lasioglossum baleicum TaxID=434251 RepID=UPI003FCE9D84
MAELHIIGKISSAVNFKQSRLLCKWSFHAGNGWKTLNGCEEGQTQESCDLYTNEPFWDHPVDIHYTTQSLHNSPKLLLQIFCRDTHERILFTSYGVCNVPLSPGLHSIECHTWKPIGNWKDQLRDKFLGITLQLKSPNVLVNSLDRFELLTESMGTVKIELQILARNFEKYGCHIINMVEKPFVLMFVYLICNDVIHAKKIEEIFSCANETECNDLVEKDETDSLSTTVKSTYTSTTDSTNNPVDLTEIVRIRITPTAQTPRKIKTNNEIRNHSIHKIQSDMCECDLVVSSCDINCCCDKDCSDFHLTVFSHCKYNQAELYDKRYCYGRNFIQRNNTPFVIEKLASNLFCILYDNLPPTYSVTNDLDIKTEKDLRAAMKPNRLKWKWEDQVRVPEYNAHNPYQDGDILWIIHNASSIQPFEILQSGFIDTCTFKKTLMYLRQWKNQCLQTELSNANKFLFPMAFNNFTVIVSPDLFNETYIEMSEQICPRNVCLTLNNYYCKHPWRECNKTLTSGSCMNGSCYNIVTGVKYLILHNGSMGVHNISVYFTIANVSQSFYQQFEVVYEWADLDKEKSFTLSGNPGYMFGKPLTIGTLNKTSNTKTVIFNKTDNFLTLPIAMRNGQCNELNRYIVNFGEDIKLRCSVSLSTDNFNTSSCIELQNRTMHFLLKDSMFNITETDQYSIYVSKTGNITNSNTNDWAQILLDRIPENIVWAQIVNDRLYCSGLITSIHLHILYSTVANSETLTNYNIQGIGVYFSNESDVSWSTCWAENCTHVLKVDIVSYVTFHDVSKPSRYYFVGGPNLDLTLPYDFFYPFLSNSQCIESRILLIFSAAFIIILHNSIY